jgi:hypothetical protein
VTWVPTVPTHRHGRQKNVTYVKRGCHEPATGASVREMAPEESAGAP